MKAPAVKATTERIKRRDTTEPVAIRVLRENDDGFGSSLSLASIKPFFLYLSHSHYPL